MDYAYVKNNYDILFQKSERLALASAMCRFHALARVKNGAYNEVMAEAKRKAPSRGRGRKRLVGPAEENAAKTAEAASKAAADRFIADRLGTYGFSSEEDFFAEAFSILEKAESLNERSEAAAERFRDDDLVTSENVELFVNLYATAAMHRNCKIQLRSMREGLLEFIPAEAWNGFSPMDFEMLVGGSPKLSVRDICSRTSFQYNGSEGGAAYNMIQNWFWSVVSGMSFLRRTKLLYFATGSTHLPRGQDRALTVEVFTPVVASDASVSEQLPTSATCSRKLMLPVYSSLAMLRKKLYLAIDHCDNYELN